MMDSNKSTEHKKKKAKGKRKWLRKKDERTVDRLDETYKKCDAWRDRGEVCYNNTTTITTTTIIIIQMRQQADAGMARRIYIRRLLYHAGPFSF